MSGWAGVWIGLGVAYAGESIAGAIKWAIRMMSRIEGDSPTSVTFTVNGTKETP